MKGHGIGPKRVSAAPALFPESVRLFALQRLGWLLCLPSEGSPCAILDLMAVVADIVHCKEESFNVLIDLDLQGVILMSLR